MESKERLPPEIASALGAAADLALNFARIRSGVGTLLGESYLVARQGELDLVWRASSLDAWIVERDVRDAEVLRGALRSELLLSLLDGPRLDGPRLDRPTGSTNQVRISLGYQEDDLVERVLAAVHQVGAGAAADVSPVGVSEAEATKGAPSPLRVGLPRTSDLDEERRRLLTLLDRPGRALSLMQARATVSHPIEPPSALPWRPLAEIEARAARRQRGRPPADQAAAAAAAAPAEPSYLAPPARRKPARTNRPAPADRFEPAAPLARRDSILAWIVLLVLLAAGIIAALSRLDRESSHRAADSEQLTQSS